MELLCKEIFLPKWPKLTAKFPHSKGQPVALHNEQLSSREAAIAVSLNHNLEQLQRDLAAPLSGAVGMLPCMTDIRLFGWNMLKETRGWKTEVTVWKDQGPLSKSLLG